jgi:C-terminal processing protease CtpA/Prc
MQTYGGVISTGSDSLIDGTTVRTPFRGWYLPDGTDMEMHGAMPDLVVAADAGGRERWKDTQARDRGGRPDEAGEVRKMQPGYIFDLARRRKMSPGYIFPSVEQQPLRLLDAVLDVHKEARTASAPSMMRWS